MVGIAQDAAEERDDGAARASSPSPTNLRASRKHNAHACGGTNSPHSSRIERTPARGGDGGGGGGGGGASRHHDGGDEREQQIGLWGAKKHRVAPPRTSISILGSRYVPPARQLSAAASSCT